MPELLAAGELVVARGDGRIEVGYRIQRSLVWSKMLMEIQFLTGVLVRGAQVEEEAWVGLDTCVKDGRNE